MFTVESADGFKIFQLIKEQPNKLWAFLIEGAIQNMFPCLFFPIVINQKITRK